MTLTRLGGLFPAIVLAVGCGGGDTSTKPVPGTAVASIDVSWSGKPLLKDSSAQMAAVSRDAQGSVVAGSPVIWASSDTQVVRVSSSGLITALARTGTATITATSDSKHGTADVPVWWLYQPRTTYAIKEMPVIKVKDPGSSRVIRILVRLPVDAPGPLPVIFIVFPTNGAETIGDRWGKLFAAAGYAAINVGTQDPDLQSLCIALNVSNADCPNVVLPERLSNARDVSVLLDSLATISRHVGVVFDTSRVGVSGPSAGGAVVMYLAGATVDVTPSVKGISLADPRIHAFMAHSAPGTTTLDGSASGFTLTSWSHITSPTMQQTSLAEELGRRELFSVLAPGDKYMALFDAGVSHQDLSGWFVDNQSDFYRFLTTNGLAFFDAYLNGIVDAKQWLTTNQLGRGTKASVQISSK